jgi:uncharacterized protein YdhG (YjbR/CyaY superfamily)
MENKRRVYKNIDEYISDFPAEIQDILEKIRSRIIKAAPEAEETISYQMPAFRLKGNLVYFAAFKNHIGFYPTSSGIEAFKNELSRYKGAKGSVQFPINEPMPFELIKKIVASRVDENKRKAAENVKKANKNSKKTT